MKDSIQELTNLRKRLLDLSLKNNLLNYHVSAIRSVEINETPIEDICASLIVQECGMTFCSMDDIRDSSVLKTPYGLSDLTKKLRLLYSRSKIIFEEQGYSSLYLALGFVQWVDLKNSDKKFNAPILLLPVELSQVKKTGIHTVRWTGEDMFVSPSLIEKCREFGVEIPVFDGYNTSDSIIGYLQSISDNLTSHGVCFTNDIVLDIFNFKKFILYNDLNPDKWPEGMGEADFPILQSIFHPQVSGGQISSPVETDFESFISSADSHIILDADSSQLEIIESAKRGLNLVVEGPPGTGKSQTIVNIIAEMLATGKTVLFVSEKMAALDVVKQRLENAGLSRFVLELHGRNAKKRDFLSELNRTLQSPSVTSQYNENNAAYLDELKKQLNDYASAVSSPVGNSGYSVYDLIGLRETYVPTYENRILETIDIENVSDITYQENKYTLSVLRELVTVLTKLVTENGSLTNYPWENTRPKLILPPEQRIIQSLLSTYINTYEKIDNLIKKISQSINLPIPESESELKVFEGILWCLSKSINISDNFMDSSLWINPSRMTDLISDISELQIKRNLVLEHFTQDILSYDILGIYRQFAEYNMHSVGWKESSPEYQELKDLLISCYLGETVDDAAILTDLKQVKDYGARLAHIRENNDVYKSVFSPIWGAAVPDLTTVERYTDFVQSIPRQKKYSTESISKITSNPSLIASNPYDELSILSSTLWKTKVDLSNHLNISDSVLNKSPSEFATIVQVWLDNIGKLGDWSRFLSHVDQCKQTPASELLPFVLEGRVMPKDVIPTYVSNYTDLLLGIAYGESIPLSTFSQATHEERIHEFIKSDKELISLNSGRICSILEAQLPDINSGNTGQVEMNVLRGEFNRKTGHMSIRSLMKHAGSVIQRIKPCFMMSPLSVAQYLDLSTIKFDVVIFDEASQIKPEDALGALMRGKQLIVMGDSQQLPPSGFFELVAESDSLEDSIAGISDMESLFHLCRNVYPIKRLRWHYRSRHESLIALSNQEFYDGSMLVFPSPRYNDENLGLSFIHLENAPYSRGEGGVNTIEAQEVAKAVVTHYKNFPNKSLGVATFSIRQQEAIRQEIDALLSENSDIERYMYPVNGEQFFVKNLETVQGDERDVIFISIGYGYDLDGKLSRSFGPLNIEGGQRRLNVLITRAREKCVVFSNFRGYELQADEHSSYGVRALADFLTYAETRTLNSTAQNNPYNPEIDGFSNMIADTLEQNGYSVVRNFGCSTFHVDIAVLNPDNSEEYLAGIICDGENYSNLKLTRDRERLRIQNLTQLNWNIIPVWSVEWYQSPDTCLYNLLQSLDSLKQSMENPLL